MKELWIARDKNGELYLYKVKPIRSEDVFYSPEYDFLDDYFRLPNDSYPEITWFNSPKKLEIID